MTAEVSEATEHERDDPEGETREDHERRVPDQARAGRKPRERRAVRGRRALRGLLGVFALTFLNLLGVLLAVTALGGLEPWTVWQFIGFFGFVEAATAVALIVAPNVWRLPVDEAASDGIPVMLTRRALLLPRWGALAKLAAGLLLLGTAATQTGISAGVVLVPVIAIAVAVLVVALSLGAARWGVARPHLDVYQFTLRRPGREELVFPGVSLSALVVQFVINITVLPVVKLAPPSILFQPGLGPSFAVAAVAMVAAVAAAALALLAWRGRVAWNDPPPANALEEDDEDAAPVELI